MWICVLIKSGVQFCVIIVYLYFSVTDEDTVKRYYAKFEEKFFQTCEKELAKINTFYSGKDCNEGLFTRERFYVKAVKLAPRLHRKGASIVFITFVFFPPEKLAEAQRRFATLQNELQSSLDAQRESWANGRGLRRRRTVFALSQQERCKHRNIKDLQLAFSEFYLSLILLQNYQVNNSVLIIWVFQKKKPKKPSYSQEYDVLTCFIQCLLTHILWTSLVLVWNILPLSL